MARYPGKVRGGQVDFSKRNTLLIFDKIFTNHICTSNSPQKNIKTEDNHERPGKISWIESMSASSIFHLLK